MLVKVPVGRKCIDRYHRAVEACNEVELNIMQYGKGSCLSCHDCAYPACFKGVINSINGTRTS